MYVLNKQQKVAVIGIGQVGATFLFNAMNNWLAQDYLLIDINKDLAKANAFDMEDCLVFLKHKFQRFAYGQCSDLKNYDLVVITAGATMTGDMTRMDLVNTNGVIIKKIAHQVKASGFKGISVIVSNPCDVLASIYQYYTGFDSQKIISAGTVLDSSRLRFFLSKHFHVHPSNINAFFLGEHGSSGFVLWSAANIMGKKLDEYNNTSQRLTHQERLSICKNVIDRGITINRFKHFTNFGIAASLVEICQAILDNSFLILPVGVYHSDNQHPYGFYFSKPTLLNQQGVVRSMKFDFSPSEQEHFKTSYNRIATVTKAFFTKTCHL